MIEDRVAKEQARRQAEQELEELKSATKVSKYSYWTGFNMQMKVPGCNWDEISAKSELNFGKGVGSL